MAGRHAAAAHLDRAAAELDVADREAVLAIGGQQLTILLRISGLLLPTDLLRRACFVRVTGLGLGLTAIHRGTGLAGVAGLLRGICLLALIGRRGLLGLTRLTGRRRRLRRRFRPGLGRVGSAVDHPERLRAGLVEVALCVIGTQHVLELANRPREPIHRRLPLGEPLSIDLEHLQWRGLYGLTTGKDAHLRSVDEVPVVCIHSEAHRRCRQALFTRIDELDRRRRRRDREPPPRFQVVELQLDVGLFERDVGAPLDVRRAAPRVVDRLAVYGDPHQVELVGILRLQLAGEPRDVHALVIVERGELVVNDLHAHERRFTADEPGVHDVVRVDESPAFVLGLRRLETHLRAHRLHRAFGARRRETHVVAVDHCGAAIQAIVRRVANEPQAHVAATGEIVHRAAEAVGVARRDQRTAILELERRDLAPGRVVHLGEELIALFGGAQLRFIGQLLQRIVVPEFDLDAPIERASLRGVVGRDGQ